MAILLEDEERSCGRGSWVATGSILVDDFGPHRHLPRPPISSVARVHSVASEKEASGRDESYRLKVVATKRSWVSALGFH